MRKRRNSVAKIFSCLGLTIAFTACAVTPEPSGLEMSPIGAWASGEDPGACQSAPITYFSSDGVVMVLLGKDGPVHSVGSWSIDENTLKMTHNDFPLKGDGISKPEVSLEILELDKVRFSTRNVKGDIRERVACASIGLMENPEHASH